jgi:hypothetical protein
VKEYFLTHGIHQRSSTAYTPEQNGGAERVNRTILEETSAMLLLNKIKLSFIKLSENFIVSRVS